MLAKPYRLPRSVSFTNARSLQTPFFRLLVKENNISHNRFGFVVSKRIDKRAVVRNRLRRVLRNAVAAYVESGSKDILFVVRQSFITEKSTDIVSLVQSTLAKLL